MGYAGGEHPDPTYHDLGDHTEAFQLDFDNERVSYRELLDGFWKAHNPHRGSYGRQYMAAVFCQTAAHAQQAAESRARLAEQTGREVSTVVVPDARFYLAEDYHQKYHLRHSPLMSELEHLSPRDFVESPVAARLNGFVAGHGTAALLDREIASYGLTPAGNQLLARLVR
ncbi:peptide-methionine (S)-S-oxide reductase [soil metagenome]